MSISLPQQGQESLTPSKTSTAPPKQVVDPGKARRAGWMLSLAAGIVAILAGIMATMYVQGMEAELGITQPVVVAARVIPAQTLITPGMLKTVELPVKYTSPTYIQSVGDLADGVTTSKIDISPGEYIQQNMVAKNASLEKGMVPITIDVNPKTTANNSVRQGNYVDVLISYKDEEGRPTTKYLLQQIKVLAVDNLLPQQGGTGDDTYLPAGSEGSVQVKSTKFVTLELTKEQAVLVTYADNFAGEMRLVIRRPDDQEILNIEPVHFIAGDEAYKGGLEDETDLPAEEDFYEDPER